MSGSGISQAEQDGASIYGRVGLALYDVGVVHLSNTLAWRCPAQRLLEHYNLHVSARHLDIGPGTGWYLQRTAFPTTPATVVLMDLNPATFAVTASRLAPRGITPETITGSILAPIKTDRGPFRSIAANFVMHCVPGSWAEKGAAFGHIADQLADDGVFFGSTILGDEAPHNLIGKTLLAAYNGPMKVFHNRGDDAAGLEAALSAAFGSVDVEVVGTVAVFSAREPLRAAA